MDIQQLNMLRDRYDPNQVFKSQAPTAPSQPQKKLGGIPGIAANFLPTIAGGAGAALGSFVGPVGTVVGGAAGAGLGEYLRQKLTGEADDGIDKGNIVQEGIFGALPGVGKGIKAVKTARAAEGGLAGAGGLRGVLTGGKLAKAADMAEDVVPGTFRNSQPYMRGVEDIIGTAQRTKGIPVKYIDNVASGVGKPEVIKKSFAGVGAADDLANAKKSLSSQGFKVSEKTSQIVGKSGAVANPKAVQSFTQDYADYLKDIDSTFKGGQIVPDYAEGGYKRISEHSKFYRDTFADKGRAPIKSEWLEEAQRQLKSGKADSYAQAEYKNFTNPVMTPTSETVYKVQGKRTAIPLNQSEQSTELIPAKRPSFTPSKPFSFGGSSDELAGAGKATAQTTETAMQARNLETAVGAKGRASERFIGSSNGIKPGAKVGSQTLTAKRATQLNEHINANIGAKPTDAADTILRRNEAFISNKTAELKSILDARNVPLERTDYRKVIAGIKKPAGLNLTDNPTHMQLTTDLQGVTDVNGLEKLRGEIDDIVNFSRSEASPDPTTERIALAWRRSIDKVVTGKVPESKEIKTALNRAFDTKTFIEPAARNPVGANVFGVRFGGRAKQGFDRAVGRGLEKMPDAMAIPAVNTSSFLGRTARAAIPQAGYRAAGMGVGIPFNGAVQQEQTEPGAGLEGTTAADLPTQEITPQTGSDSPFSGANIETNVQKILANGGTMKEVTEYLNIVKTMQALQPSGGKPMSSESAKTLTNAKAGVQAIADFEASINDDPGAFGRTNLPGSGFLDNLTGGRVSGALGTSEINASSQQIIDVLARLRTGAAISRQEEARFKTYIPLPGDPPEVRQQKLGYLRDQFTEVANRVNNSPQVDSETALTR